MLIRENYEGEGPKSAQGSQDMLLQGDGIRAKSLRLYTGWAEKWRLRGWKDIPGGENNMCQNTKARWAMAHFL